MVLDQWFEFVHDEDVLFMFWPVFMFDNFLAVFMFLDRFPFEFVGHYVEYLRQFLPFLANLKVIFFQLTIVYQTVLCNQKYML